MPLQLPRADDLRVLRAICHHLYACPDYSSKIGDLKQWIASSAQQFYGTAWKKTRIYHYTSALLELGLANKSGPHVYRLTAEGKKIAECNPILSGLDTPLSETEKDAFVSVLSRYEAVVKYLSCFMPSGRGPRSMKEFVRSGRPINIVRTQEDNYELTTAHKDVLNLSRAEKMSYAWTIYGWLRSLEMADDFYIERPASFMLGGKEVRCFYPLQRKCIEVEELRGAILALAKAKKKPVAVFYIPDLLAKICTAAGIPKKNFLERLVDLQREDPIRFHLEIMSSLRSDSRCKAHYHYSNFPRVRGVLRSHLCVKMRRGK